MTNRFAEMVFGACIIASGCAHANHGADGTTTSAAQYAAIANDLCMGMPAKERETGLLAYREDIERVVPLLADGPFGGEESNPVGAAIRLRATQGMSVPWLDRVNRCQVALVASWHRVGKESTEDPFLIPGATVSPVDVYGGYYDLSVRGDNDASAMEILRRSKALLSAPLHQPTASLGSP
jgi:hypothetical protein